MTIELRGGPDQLARISRQLKTEARNLERTFNKELRAAAQPFKRAIADTAERLPQTGGLSRRVARARVGVRNRAARGKGVQITVGARRSQMQQINAGFVFHPVFGGERRVRQAVPAGFVDDAARAAEDEVTRGVERTIGRMSDRIDRVGRGL